MGRKPRTPATPATARVKFAATNGELATYRAAASLAGLSLSAWIRGVCDAAARTSNTGKTE